MKPTGRAVPRPGRWTLSSGNDNCENRTMVTSSGGVECRHRSMGARSESKITTPPSTAVSNAPFSGPSSVGAIENGVGAPFSEVTALLTTPASQSENRKSPLTRGYGHSRRAPGGPYNAGTFGDKEGTLRTTRSAIHSAIRSPDAEHETASHFGRKATPTSARTCASLARKAAQETALDNMVPLHPSRKAI
jgi:hypothetical protein